MSTKSQTVLEKSQTEEGQDLTGSDGSLNRNGVLAVTKSKKLDADDEAAALAFFLADDNDVPESIILEITRTCDKDENGDEIEGTGVKLIHRPIMEDELKRLQKRAATGEKLPGGGKAVDLILLYRFILVETMVTPNLKSMDVLEKFGGPENALKAKILPGEIEGLAQKVMILSGFSDDAIREIKPGHDDDVTLAKN